jgi:hypothetical protein
LANYNQLINAAQFESLNLLDGSNDAQLLGPQGTEISIQIDLQDLSERRIFASGFSSLVDLRESVRANTDLNAAIKLTRAARNELVEAERQVNGQAPAALPKACDIVIPQRFLPSFAAKVQRSLNSSEKALIQMRLLA